MNRSSNSADSAAASLPPAIAQAIEISTAAGLVYVSDCEPGISRTLRRKTYIYMAPDNTRITDRTELKRLASLAIPPAYTQVWICMHARGHLQATGYDARGRKQYRYHGEWRAVRDAVKFERMVEFGEALPRLRRRLRRDLARQGLPREKVLAVIVTLLDTTHIRVGNEEYARTNKSFGLTTLRDRHVQFVRDGRAMFKFRGKSGAVHEILLNDKRLARIVRSCQELPGQQLFQYVGDDGASHPIDSDQVNVYLKEAMGSDFTAKDFRTWGATLHAIALMARTPLPSNARERELKMHITTAVKEVAKELRNTPAVCRKSYINPVVFTAWRSGSLHKIVRQTVQPNSRQAEAIALRFLRSASISEAHIPAKRIRKRAVERATKRLVKALEQAGQLDGMLESSDAPPAE